LTKKLHEIEVIIDEEKPHVIGLSEARVEKGQDLNNFFIEHYKLFLSDTVNNPNLNVSRLCVLVHDSVTTKVRHDLMNDHISSVWLELGFPRQKKILLANFYR